MTTPPRRAAAVLTAVLAATLLAACAQQEQPAITENASVRSAVVAEQLGTEISVRRAEWLPCLDSVGESDGEEYVDGIRVELARQESFEQVADRLRPHFEDLGWTWRDADLNLQMVRLEKDGYLVAASVFIDDGYASLTGGAGCLATIEDVPEQDRTAS